MSRDAQSAGFIQHCQSKDLTCGARALLLWCVPIVALILGSAWPEARPWLWMPALLVMGIACLVNAARCGRLHCYLTGPIFLIAAGYVVLAEFEVVPLPSGMFLDALLVAVAIPCLLEIPFGKYIHKG